MNEYHIPVLAEESIELLDIRPEGSYADLTFGGGGHSSLILSKLGSRGRLYAFDQDADAKANAFCPLRQPAPRETLLADVGFGITTSDVER